MIVFGFCGQANSFVLQKGGISYQHWLKGDLPIPFSINPSGFPAGGIDAIMNSFQAWEDVATATISFTYSGTTTIDTIGHDGTNVILWITNSADWTHGATVAAYTTTYVDASSGRILGADVEFNGTPEYTQNYPWSASGEPGKLDIENMLTHELGHFIGIDHICDAGYPDNCQKPYSLTCRPCSPTDREATMYHLMDLGETKKRTLEQDDIDAVSFLYPSSPVLLEMVSGNGQSGTPGVSLAEPFVVRVTDGGGTPLEGRFVLFHLVSGTGTIADTDPIVSDADGLAQTTFTPDSEDRVQVRATAAGLVQKSFFVNNQAPVLDWTDELNYENDGLHPELGYHDTDFVFRVKYTDAEWDPPELHRVWIDINGDDLFDTEEKFDMTREGFPYYGIGVIYTYSTTIPFSPGSSNCKYYFEFSDSASPAEGLTQAVSPETAINAPDVLQTLNLSVTPASWAIGLIGPGAVVQSPKFELSNGGDGPETFSLQITDEGFGWTADTTSGSEIYSLRALFGGFSDNAPTLSHFETDDVVSTAQKAATSSDFGNSVFSATGESVPVGEQRALWLLFSAPTETTLNGMQSILVTISGQP